MNESMLTPIECASIASVHKATVYRWIRSGKLSAYKFGKNTYLVKQSDLEEFLDGYVEGRGRTKKNSSQPSWLTAILAIGDPQSLPIAKHSREQASAIVPWCLLYVNGGRYG